MTPGRVRRNVTRIIDQVCEKTHHKALRLRIVTLIFTMNSVICWGKFLLLTIKYKWFRSVIQIYPQQSDNNFPRQGSMNIIHTPDTRQKKTKPTPKSNDFHLELKDEYSVCSIETRYPLEMPGNSNVAAASDGERLGAGVLPRRGSLGGRFEKLHRRQQNSAALCPRLLLVPAERRAQREVSHRRSRERELARFRGRGRCLAVQSCPREVIMAIVHSCRWFCSTEKGTNNRLVRVALVTAGMTLVHFV